MKTAAFSDALTYLDDDLVREVRTKRNAPRTAWMGWAAAAACLALVIYAGVKLHPAPSAVTPVTPVTPGTETVEPVTPVETGERALICSWSTDGFDEQACYAMPRPGECGYTIGVRDAMEKYGWTSSDDVEDWRLVPTADAEKYADGPAFLVAFDLFGKLEEKEVELADGTVEIRDVHVDVTEEEKEAEYRRLQEAGVELFETTVWEYNGPSMRGERVTCTVVTAMVTGEQLAHFPISEDYGYFFYFPHNGDYSAPEGVPGDALILPELWPHR